MYTLQQSDVYDAANSSDNCSIASVSFPATTFGCDDLDLTFPVMVTVEDPSGNTDDCTANVSVVVGTALPTAAFQLKDENFGAWQADLGELRSVFAVPQGLVLPKDEVIFELEFQIVNDGAQLSEVLRLDNGILDGRVYDTRLNGGTVALAFERDGKLPNAVLPGEHALGFALQQNMPNPFSN
jgi:hypothetical protein